MSQVQITNSMIKVQYIRTLRMKEVGGDGGHSNFLSKELLKMFSQRPLLCGDGGLGGRVPEPDRPIR